MNDFKKCEQHQISYKNFCTLCEHEKTETPATKPGLAPVSVNSSEWVEELRAIVASGMRRRDELGAADQPFEVNMLLELPLTTPEYNRLRQIVSSSTVGDLRHLPADKTQPEEP